MADILEALITGLSTFLNSTAGLQLVSFAIIAAVVGFVFSIPKRVYKNMS